MMRRAVCHWPRLRTRVVAEYLRPSPPESPGKYPCEYPREHPHIYMYMFICLYLRRSSRCRACRPTSPSSSSATDARPATPAAQCPRPNPPRPSQVTRGTLALLFQYSQHTLVGMGHAGLEPGGLLDGFRWICVVSVCADTIPPPPTPRAGLRIRNAVSLRTGLTPATSAPGLAGLAPSASAP